MREKTLLLVEDDPQAVLLARRTFKKMGLELALVVASDGAEALRYLIETHTENQGVRQLPAVVLLDLDLPKVHGFEVLKRLRAHPRTKALPVIILTSSDRESDAVHGYTLGANSFMRKPLNFQELMRNLSNLQLDWITSDELVAEGKN